MTIKLTTTIKDQIKIEHIKPDQFDITIPNKSEEIFEVRKETKTYNRIINIINSINKMFNMPDDVIYIIEEDNVKAYWMDLEIIPEVEVTSTISYYFFNRFTQLLPEMRVYKID